MHAAARESAAVRLAGWAGALALVAIVWSAVLPTLSSVVYMPESDEGYYLRYMRDVSERGLGAIPGQFTFYLGDQRHWIFPPPSRVGFTLACAAWSKLFGSSLQSLSQLSLASHLAMIVLVFAGTRRWLATYAALLVTALVACSTLYLGLARLALTDSFISLTQVAIIFLFLEYLRDPARKLVALSFAAAFAMGMLTKEIAVLLALPFAALAAIERCHGKRPIPIVRTVLVLIVPGIACVVGWTLAAGGVETLRRVIEIVLGSPATNVYAIQMGSGGWCRYPVDEFLMSPWPTALGLAGGVIALWRWRKGEYDALSVGLTLIYLAQVGVLSFFTKNLRYVAVLEVPLRILAVVLLLRVFELRRPMLGRALCTLAVVAMCWFGWADYKLFWLRWKVLDPVTHVLVGVRRMVPTQQSP
jgi:hypothetical protein